MHSPCFVHRDIRFVRNGSVDPQTGGLRPCDGHWSIALIGGPKEMRERAHPGNCGAWTLGGEMVYAALINSAQRLI